MGSTLARLDSCNVHGHCVDLSTKGRQFPAASEVSWQSASNFGCFMLNLRALTRRTLPTFDVGRLRNQENCLRASMQAWSSCVAVEPRHCGWPMDLGNCIWMNQFLTHFSDVWPLRNTSNARAIFVLIPVNFGVKDHLHSFAEHISI
jgi:hypothetical protein